MRIDLFKKRMTGPQPRRARRACEACAPKAVRQRRRAHKSGSLILFSFLVFRTKLKSSHIERHIKEKARR